MLLIYHTILINLKVLIMLISTILRKNKNLKVDW
jgi:hypothetical protein